MSENEQEFTPELQEQVGDGQDEQPGADGAPKTEDYDFDPRGAAEQSDDDEEQEDPEKADDAPDPEKADG